MGKKAPSPPAAPDPAATAQAQATANKEAAIAQAQINQVNQYTPYGSLEYTQRGTAEDGTPQYSATQTLSDEQQQILDQQNTAALKYGQTANQQLSSVSDKLSQPVDFSGLGAAPTFDSDYRTTVENALFDRLNPQLQKDRDALITSLANQGITDPASQAYMDAIDELNRQENDARLGILASGQSLAGQQYANELASRNQAINEITQQRSIPLNELAAMLTGTQVQSPQFINAPQQSIAPGDIMGATYANANLANQNYAQQMANNRAQTSGLYSLIGAGAGLAGATYGGAGWTFSDRRLKTHIKRLGTAPNGLGLYSWVYRWGVPAIGYMADEVRDLYPKAVKRFGEYDAVNYAEVPNG